MQKPEIDNSIETTAEEKPVAVARREWVAPDFEAIDLTSAQSGVGPGNADAAASV